MTHVTLSRVASIKAPLSASGKLKVINVTLEGLVSKVSRAQKRGTPCVLPGPLESRTQGDRGTPRLSHASAVILDLDAVPTLEVPLLPGLAHAAWETASSAPLSLRARVVVPLALPLSPELYPAVYRAVGDYLAERVSGVQVDPACARPTQKAVLPCLTALGREPGRYHVDGPLLDVSAPWFQPYLDARMKEARADLLVRSAPRRPIESQPDVIRAFNQVYADPEVLSQAYSHVMGCRYEPSGTGRWTWVGLDGTRASQPGLVASSEVEGAFLDFYGSSPVAGRAVFPFDILMAQGRLHSGVPVQGAMPEAASLFWEASKTYMDLAQGDPEVLNRVIRNRTATLASHSSDTSEPRGVEALKAQWDQTAGEDSDDPDLAYILTKKLGQKSRASLTDLECAMVARYSRTLRRVWRSSRDGSYSLALPEGGYKVLGEDDVDTLFDDVLQECGPVESISQRNRKQILTLATTKYLRQERDPFAEYLKEAADEWRRSPEVLLTPDEGGLTPGAEPTPLNRLYLATFVRAVAARTLYPGVRYEQMLVLRGGQGSGKTSLLEALSGSGVCDPALLQEMSVPALRMGETARHSVLSRVSAASVAVVDEMTALTREDDAAALKTVLSQTRWSATGKYETLPTSRDIRFVLAGTTNSEAFLPPDDGIRRYMVYEVTKVTDPVMTDLITPGSGLLRRVLGEAAAWAQDTYERALAVERTEARDERTAMSRAVQVLTARLGAQMWPGGSLFREHLAQAARFAAMGEIAVALATSVEGAFPGEGDLVSLDPRTVKQALEGVGYRLGDPSVRMALAFHVSALGGRVSRGGWVYLPVSVADTVRAW